jgi:hypothetical protein
MFNHKASNTARQEYLLSLLERALVVPLTPLQGGLFLFPLFCNTTSVFRGVDDEMAEEDDDEILGDDVLNSMLSRSDDELVLFAKMDSERAAEDSEWMTGARKVERRNPLFSM